ncbi:MAG: DMT family transporter [Leucothrix sp.]
MSAPLDTTMIQPDRTGFAIVMVIFGTSTVAFADLATKWLTTNLSLWQLQSMRSVFGICFLLLVLIALRKLPALKVISIEAVVIRSLLMTFTYLSFFTALAVLPITMVAGGFFSGPLFMVLLASVMLKEKIGIWRIASAIGGFIGVLLILQPSASQFDPMIFLPVLCGFVYALTQVYTRKHCKNEDPLAISFWLTFMFLQSGLLGLLILSLLPAAPDPGFLTRPPVMLPLPQLLTLVAVAIASVVMHFAIAAAYQNAPATLVAPLEYLYLPIAIIGGYFFFDERPNAVALLGVMIVIAAGFIITWRERKMAQALNH